MEAERMVVLEEFFKAGQWIYTSAMKHKKAFGKINE